MMIIEHIKNRNCNLTLYTAMLNKKDNICTFLCWNLSGKPTGYIRYNPFGLKKNNTPENAKYFVYSNKNEMPMIFGIETLNRGGPVLLVEGLFDAARLHNNGYAALAMLSNNPKKCKSFLKILNRKYITICDGDDSGKKLAKYGHKSITLSNGEDVSSLGYVEYNKLLMQINEMEF